MGGLSEPELVCPRCASQFPADLRFCPDCKLPLVLKDSGEEPGYESPRYRRMRKVKPQLSEGELVKVAWARNEAEGEFIQGLLLEEGVPSLLRRSAGFDVPDFLAAGPRDVMARSPGRRPRARFCCRPTWSARTLRAGRWTLGGCSSACWWRWPSGRWWSGCSHSRFTDRLAV